MKTKELRSRPLKELLELQRRVSAAIKTKQAQMKKARERLVSLANMLGVSARELASLVSKRGPDKAPRKARVKVGRMHVNPKAPEQTWNGKGRPPGWFKAMKANGAAESRATH